MIQKYGHQQKKIKEYQQNIVSTANNQPVVILKACDQLNQINK